MGTVAKMSFSSATAGKAMAAGFCNQERATKIQDSLGYKIYKQEDMGSDTFAYRWISDLNLPQFVSSFRSKQY